jgi:DNA-binding HxlR family transcriptional regulator
MRDALMGVTRFEDFHSRLGISRNILSMRLEQLVAHGILEKKVYQQRPRRHRYLLTDKGRDLWLVVTAMRQWGDKWAGKDGPPVELVHRGCGQVTTVEPACSECGALIDASELYPVLGPGAQTPDVIPRG